MNNWYKISRMDRIAKERDYSWVSISLPKNIGSKTMQYAKTIPERELFIKKEEKGEVVHGKGWKYGVEDDPHITVLWGIHTKDVRKVRKILEEQKGGTVKLGQIGMFEKEEYDVLKVNIISSALHRIHYALQENLEHSSTFPDYHPHVTLAYLKCGNGEKYIKNRKFEGLKFDFDEVIFEDYEDKSTTIKLMR
ncbi:MAG: 2'-5' RNA ligase family protein [Synergistaceae bacterium]